jgi:ATPase subunit of ABC transporter with duplicated ATPase domains
VLLLDDRTHLDVETLRALEDARGSGTIVISHDRWFLDQLRPTCSFEGDSRISGSPTSGEEEYTKTLGADASKPKLIVTKKAWPRSQRSPAMM